MCDLIQRYESIKQAAQLSVRHTGSLDFLVRDILNKVVVDTLYKYQQKVNVGIQDSVSDLLDGFKQKITQSIFDVANTWKVANREPVLFPRGCRFCYTRGESTIFVIEQDPQVRTLSFMKSMLGESFHFRAETPEYVSLALPYVVFVIHFRRDQFAGLYCGWRRHALTNLDNMLSRPILPNIHDTLNVCMGTDASTHYGNGSLAEKSLNILGTFWNSTFNNDVSSFWWGKSSISQNLRSARVWAEKSSQDGAFILQINLPETRSLQYILDLLVMHEQEPDENAFRHKLSEDIDVCVEKLFVGIMRYFKKTKFERHHPQEIADSVRTILEQSVAELTDVVFALNVEVQKMRNDIRKSAPIMKGAGKYWTDYS